MKKGLLVALFGLALVATLALPQMASAAVPLDNVVTVDQFTTISGPVTVNISATATVNVLASASLAITKGVHNLTRFEVTPSTSTDAIVGDVVKYTVALWNDGEDVVTSVNFIDQVTIGLPPNLNFCVAGEDPGAFCENPVWVSPTLGNGTMIRVAPDIIRDDAASPIQVDIGGFANATIVTYTAIVVP
ncbi:MAG: hypothetical protein JSU92_12550 [Deltaproteobacteria bacterium]|nr:MAG: hypothetical protein JSU92_12550 [Deltaproteobacteria bacterium]